MIRLKRTLTMVALAGTFGFGAIAVAQQPEPPSTAPKTEQPTSEPRTGQTTSEPKSQTTTESKTTQTTTEQQGQQPSGQETQPRSGQEAQPRSGQTETQPREGTQPAMPMEVEAAEVNASGTVQQVDRKGRKVVVKDNEGNRMELQVGPDVAGFDQLKKGDQVDVTYFESVAVSLEPARAGEPAPAAKERRVATTHQLGGGVVAREIETAIPLTKVDAQRGSVEFKGMDGSTRTVKVSDPKMKDMLKDLKAGDVVDINFTEAVATAIRPASK